MSAVVDIIIHPHPRNPRVRINGRRPPDLLPLLRGHRAEDAPGVVRMVLSVCGHAQARATALAMGLRDHPAAGPAGAAAVLGELAREHLLRVLRLREADAEDGDASRNEIERIMGLPQELAFSAQESGTERKEAAAWLTRLLRKRVFGMPPQEWRGIASVAELEAWMSTAETSPARRLHRLWREGLAEVGLARPRFLCVPAGGRTECMALAGWLYRRLLEPDGASFAALPHHHGRPCETGALARQRHHPLLAEMLRRVRGAGLLARHVARLLELAELPRRIVAPPENVGRSIQDAAPFAGMGLVESARGLLAHAAACDAAGNVRVWRALAPTEWNFHPEGVLREALCDAAVRFHDAPAQLRTLAEDIVQALDPCMRSRVAVAPPEADAEDAAAAQGVGG